MIIVYFIGIVVCIWMAAVIFPYIIAYFEKEYLKGDLELKAYDKEVWNLLYLKEKQREAELLGFKYCGSFYTAKEASIVKGYMLLYISGDGRSCLKLISARILGLELKKTIIMTISTEEVVYLTTDAVLPPDCTHGTLVATYYQCSLDDLVSQHANWIDEMNVAVRLNYVDSMFRDCENLDIARGERLVALGLAKWVGDSKKCIKRTLQGAITTVRANKDEANRVIRDVSIKRNQFS